jgi:hypothetical protein
MTEEKLQDQNALSTYIAGVIASAPGDNYNQQMRHALEKELSKAAANFYLVTTFTGMWGNGGMQHVLLCDPDEIADKQLELERTVEAFRYYGCKDTAAFLSDLIPKAAAWSKAIGELNSRESESETIPETKFKKIWDEVDKLDEPFDKG